MEQTTAPVNGLRRDDAGTLATPCARPRCRLHLGDRGRAVALPLLLAAAPFALAYANGGFDIATRSVAGDRRLVADRPRARLPVWPLERPPRAAIVSGCLLAGYALLVLASTLWSDGAEAAFVEANRASLMLGAFVVGVAASRRSDRVAWSDAFALATSATAVVALASRCFPGLFDDRGLAAFLPGWQERLSFPLGYWNGLAIFVALGVPPLLRRASASSGSHVARALGVAALPPVGAVAFLAASRGGFATALVGAPRVPVPLAAEGGRSRVRSSPGVRAPRPPSPCCTRGTSS